MTSKKLYEVSVEYTIYAVEEDQWTAEQTARSHAHQEDPDLVIANEITMEDRIDKRWLHAIPYGDHEHDQTCLEIFRDLQPPEPPYEDPNQMKLPGCE